MRVNESAIGKKVSFGDYQCAVSFRRKFGVGEIVSDPELQGVNTYEVMVRWSSNQVSKHPLKRLQEVKEK